MSDLIDRKAAVEAAVEYLVEYCGGAFDEEMQNGLKKTLDVLPSAHPEDFEWCAGCKEYDHERGCCPRFSKVIAETVAEVKENLQVVYCKDCENFTPGKDEWGSCFENPLKMWRDTDFCSWAERRTDEDN